MKYEIVDFGDNDLSIYHITGSGPDDWEYIAWKELEVKLLLLNILYDI